MLRNRWLWDPRSHRFWLANSELGGMLLGGPPVILGGNISRLQDFDTVNTVYAQHLNAPFPARTTIEVAALPLQAETRSSAEPDRSEDWAAWEITRAEFERAWSAAE